MTQLRALLSNRTFQTIWASTVVSGLGDKIAVIALYVLVYNLTGRAVNLGLLAAVQILPAVVLGPVVGLILDRYDRKAVMVWSDFCSAVVVALMPFVQSLGQVYLAAGLLAVGRQFTGPARLAIVPDVVPDNQLDKANALAMITRNLVQMTGPALGGVIVALWGTSSAFWVDSGTFLASALLMVSRSFVYLAREKPDTAEEGAPGTPAIWRALREIRQGVMPIWEQPRLRFAILFMGATVFVTAMQAPLLVFFIKDVLARGDADLGLILSAAGVGGILGAMGSGLFQSRQRPLRTITWLLTADGLLLVLFALSRNFLLVLSLVALFGSISTILQINLATFLQRETPASKRGRIFGWLGALLAPLSLISVFSGTLLADAVSVVLVLALSGIFEVTVGLGGWYRLRAVLPANTPAAAAPTAAASAPRSEEGRGHQKPREMSGEA
jgi:MFS family permease